MFLGLADKDAIEGAWRESSDNRRKALIALLKPLNKEQRAAVDGRLHVRPPHSRVLQL